MYRLAPSLLIIAAVIGGTALAQTLNPAPDDNRRLCDLEAIFASIPVYDECGTVTTTTEGSGTIPPAPTVESSTSAPPLSTTTTTIVYEPGVWSTDNGYGPIWTPPRTDTGFAWYPDSEGVRIGWRTDDGSWDYGTRDGGWDPTGPLEDSLFHYYNDGWVQVPPDVVWRVDGTRTDGSPFEEFWWWVVPSTSDPLTETEPAETCFAPYPCVVPSTTVAVYPTTGPS